MRPLEPAAIGTRFIEDADQVDHGISAVELARQRCTIMHITILDHHPRQHAELEIQLAIARQHTDPMTIGSEEKKEQRIDSLCDLPMPTDIELHHFPLGNAESSDLDTNAREQISEIRPLQGGCRNADGSVSRQAKRAGLQSSKANAVQKPLNRPCVNNPGQFSNALATAEGFGGRR